MSSNGRAVARPRAGLPRPKVLVDEKLAIAARREPSEAVKSAKVATGRERTALNDLSHPNRLKPTLVPGKENKALVEKQNAVAPAAATIPTTNTTTTSIGAPTGRPRSGSVIPTQTQLPAPVRTGRPHSTSSTVGLGVTKIPSTRHSHRGSAPGPTLARTASGRLRDNDDEADPVSRKRIRNLGGAARPAPSLPSSASASSVGTVPPSDDRMETSEAEVLDLSEVLEETEDDDDETTAVPSLSSNHQDSDTKTLVVEPPRSLTPEPETEAVPRWWTEASPESEVRYAAEIAAIRQSFKDEADEWDPSMVSEYSDEIFDYMGGLELKAMPDPNYMENQNEIQWHQRTTLVDWLIQIHARYHLIPETLWIAINIIDRFLSKRVVSLVKLQLVGVTAMFIASKYEEIMAPSVDEFVFMTENGYTRDEILKGEKIILQSLNFHISAYCSPYSWVRRISKADDYDIQTRTLSKFLMEACLLDHRFLCAKPSMLAAIAMYTSRRMLEGDWNEAFVFYSGFTEEQLEPGFEYLVETIAAPGFNDTHTYRKYAHKRFLKSSIFARTWTKTRWQWVAQERGICEDMALDH